MKADREKVEFVIQLIRNDKTYREIQAELKKKFGSSMSNSTIKKIQHELKTQQDKHRDNIRLKKELEIFKQLYFEAMERIEVLEKLLTEKLNK